MQDYKLKVPCDDCIHKNVCNVRKNFEETKVETTHPYIIVKLECTEFRAGAITRKSF